MMVNTLVKISFTTTFLTYRTTKTTMDIRNIGKKLLPKKEGKSDSYVISRSFTGEKKEGN